MTQSTEQLSNTRPDTIAEKIDDVDRKLTENSLAWEMLREQKQTIKRLFAVIFVLIILWFSTVVGFGIYLNQFDSYDTYEEIQAEQDGDSNIVSGGDVNYGTTDSQN